MHSAAAEERLSSAHAKREKAGGQKPPPAFFGARASKTLEPKKVRRRNPKKPRTRKAERLKFLKLHTTHHEQKLALFPHGDSIGRAAISKG